MPVNSLHQIVALSGEVMRWLLTWSWQVCFLLAAAWAVLKLDRSQSPAVRYRIWLIALAAVSVLPLLTALSHSLRLPSAIVPFPTEIASDTPILAEIRGPARPAFSWPSLVWPILFVLWAAGVIISLLRLAASLWKLHIIQAGSRPVSILDLGCSHTDLPIDAGKVSIVLSRGIQSPGLAGLFRPVILLPADIARWTSRAERTSILRHEFAHIKRHDHLVSLFQSILRAFLFFHPVLRYGCAQLSLEREFACDDHVIGLGTEPKAYAESILKAAERSLLTDVIHQTPSFASRRMLERRIDMILDTGRVRPPLRQWQFLLLPVALIATLTWLVIPAASSQPRLQGEVIQSMPDAAISDHAASSAFGQTQAAPVVDRSTLWVGSVKRGPLVRQVRGLGVLVPADDGRLKAVIGIFEPQAGNIEIGQPAVIATRESSIPGRVAGINPQVTNGQITVEVAPEGNLPGNMKAGIQIDGTIEIERLDDVLQIARPVHGQANGTVTLFKLADDGLTAARVQVTFGRSSVKTIEIVDGLQIGDRVILSDMSAYEGVAVIRLN